MRQTMRIIMRPRRDTSIGQITIFMDVHAVFRVWVQSLDHTGYLRGLLDLLLTEGHKPANVGLVWIQDTHSVTASVRRDEVIEQDWGKGQCSH